MISANVLFFWIGIMFVFWLGALAASSSGSEAAVLAVLRHSGWSDQNANNESMGRILWLHGSGVFLCRRFECD